ncbi:anthranilate phosphoribosyltransferase [Inmirania thermothiophila]|uniref:Anthranilate phosphoribosyltransferase n=1 Tax=Inmirania thermothiophila TaxID=1750597 RepID=A0A3N1XSB3_9GAMM|nr:anthranilate phosphoribosyltransferase [Inmirania thermothiophila]ROR29539.1 anthranilate phosphoribosyltransferase [Inmirania thermothiophila]
MQMQEAIRRVVEGGDLTAEEMTAVMRAVMGGEATPAQIGGFLVGLRMKGETVEEIAAAAAVMRELATPVRVDVPHLVDTCGTGGDAAGTFNISTAAAFVVAAAGGHVAKHGNRSVSSRSGSADLLEAAGVRLELTPEQVARCIREVGVGFLFAPRHHGAMRHAIGPRREMGVRTVFNLLGPLTNPAGARRQVIGVFDRRWVEPMAEVLGRLGSEHVLVVHAEDGLDEISVSAPTEVAELRGGTVRSYRVTPEGLGLARSPLEALVVAGPAESLAVVRGVLGGEGGPAADVVAANAGAALYVAGLAPDLAAGVARARELMASGEPLRRLEALARLTESMA